MEAIDRGEAYIHGCFGTSKITTSSRVAIKQFKCPDLGVNKLSRMTHYEKESGGKCSHCGRRNHSSGQCRLKDLSCHKCGEKGHIAAVCRNKAKAKWVDVEEDQDGNQCHMIATIGRYQLPALVAEVCVRYEGSSVHCFRVHL